MRWIAVLSVVIGCLALPARALAWDANAYWYEPANGGQPPAGSQSAVLPGAGGILATGGASDHNITCADCHLKAAGAIDSSFLFDGKSLTAYSPGHTYRVTARLLYEHLGLSGCGPYVNGNVNNFGATFEDAGGNVVGGLASDGNTAAASCSSRLPTTVTGTTLTYGDCHAITSTSTKDLAQWSFSWTAPAAGTGTVTLYYGMVDGNCMMDSLGDDVKVANLKLAEGAPGAMAEPRPDADRALACVGLYPALALVAALRLRPRRRT
jgi:hypothetical protein